jgi:hypothetical protein
MKTGARVFYIHENFLQKGGAGPHPDRGKVNELEPKKTQEGMKQRASFHRWNLREYSAERILRSSHPEGRTLSEQSEENKKSPGTH